MPFSSQALCMPLSRKGAHYWDPTSAEPKKKEEGRQEARKGGREGGKKEGWKEGEIISEG